MQGKLNYICINEHILCVVGDNFMVAYFCHHLSHNYVDYSDLYFFLSVLYVDLSLIRLLENKY